VIDTYITDYAEIQVFSSSIQSISWSTIAQLRYQTIIQLMQNFGARVILIDCVQLYALSLRNSMGEQHDSIGVVE